MTKYLFVVAALGLASCGPSNYIPPSDSRDHVEQVVVNPPTTPYRDKDRGHGNDPDRHDEDNPGKGKNGKR